MSTDRYRNPLLNTLGFFLQGVPVVFVRTDIVFPTKPEHIEYLKFYQECVRDRSRNADFRGQELLRGCAYATAMQHEAKHFHDALLCRPLFELFVLRSKVSFHVMQLIRQFRGLSMERLPLDIKVDYPDLLSTKGTRVLQEIRRSMDVYVQHYASVFEPIQYGGTPLTLSYLMETSAMVLELVNVLSVHGEHGARDYYEQIVLPLPPEYNLLLRIFVQRRGDLISALDALYTLVVYSLYCSDNPVRTFVSTLERVGEDITGSVLKSLQTDLRRLPFEGEGDLRRRIEKIQVVATDGSDVEGIIRDDVVGPMLTFYRTIYACREQLLQVYVDQFGLALDRYLEGFDNLPTPPVLFLPVEATEGRVETVSERQLRQIAPELFVIRKQPGEAGDFDVIAGLRSLPGCQSIIPLDIADLHLQSRFYYMRLFENQESLYSKSIDEVYLDIFRSKFVDLPQRT